MADGWINGADCDLKTRPITTRAVRVLIFFEQQSDTTCKLCPARMGSPMRADVPDAKTLVDVVLVRVKLCRLTDALAMAASFHDRKRHVGNDRRLLVR